jgi:hypothetical protein
MSKSLRLERINMRIKANRLIARSAYGVALALLFAATPFDITRASIDSSYLKKVPNLAGTWQINRGKSDDPQKKIREAMGGGHGGGLRAGRSSGGGGGLPGDDGFPGAPPHGDFPERGNPPSGEQVGNMQARMEERMRAAEALEIIQSESEITVNETGDDRLVHTQTFYTDRRKSDEDSEYEKLETNAKWVGSKLVVEMKTERGGKITRTYELRSDGSELYVTLKIKNETTPQAFSIRSVYDKIQ